MVQIMAAVLITVMQPIERDSSPHTTCWVEEGPISITTNKAVYSNYCRTVFDDDDDSDSDDAIQWVGDGWWESWMRTT